MKRELEIFLKIEKIKYSLLQSSELDGTKNKSRRALTYKDLSVEYLRKELEGSLSRLQIDAIPLYLVHWPI